MYNTIQYNIVQYNICTIQYMYNAIQYNTCTMQYNTVQYNTLQYNTLQYNTLQYNTMQYNTLFTFHTRLGIQPHCSGMSPCSPPERRLGAWGWALVTDVSSQMYIFTSRRLTAIHAVVHQIRQILCNGKHCLEAWSCQGCFLDIVETCVQILNKYERLFTEERQEPSGHADAFTLTCMFVYCGSEEYYGFVSCCCTKSRTSPKLKTFFHWYVFHLLVFRQVMARET